MLDGGNRRGQLREVLGESRALCRVIAGCVQEGIDQVLEDTTGGWIGWNGIDEAIERGGLGGLLLLVAVAEADGFQHGGEDAECCNVFAVGELSQVGVALGEVMQAETFEFDGDGFQAPVHIVDVGDILRRPEALCDGCGAWPDARVDGALIELLTPHADFAAEDEALLLRGEIDVGGEWVCEVVLGGRVHGIEIVRRGEDSLIALLCSVDQRGFAAPGLNDDVAGQGRIEDFVPADHAAVQGGEYFQDALIEVSLQRIGVFEVMQAHEGGDTRVGLPVGREGLIASDVDVGIGEDLGHLGEKRRDQLIGFFAGGIEGVGGDAKLAADACGGGAAGERRIGDQPGGAVAGHLKLRHDADAAVVRVGDDLARLLLRVEEAVGALRCERGESEALHPEALVFGEVPVEDVHLDGGHGIEGALDDVDGFEVSAAIDHESAPGEARLVDDRDGGDDVVLVIRLYELQQRLQAVHGAYHGSRVKGHGGGGDTHPVGLILIRGLD